MHYLKYYYLDTIVYDLMNKFCYKKIFRLPKIKTLKMSIKSPERGIFEILSSVFLLKVLGYKNSLLDHINKGKKNFIKNIVRCFVIARKNLFYGLVERLLKLNYKKLLIIQLLNKNIILMKLTTLFIFPLLKLNYPIFKNVTCLDIFLYFNSHIDMTERNFMLKSYKFLTTD